MRIREDNVGNPYLSNNRAPVLEERSDNALEITGSLPAELRGMFVRTGPNPRFAPKGLYHWFDGDGMVHGVYLSDRGASYRNRWVRTKGFEVESREGQAIWRGVMYPPDFGNPAGPGKNPSNTNIMFSAGEVLSLWEGGAPYVLRLPELGTEGAQKYGGKLKGPMTAHPHRDNRTGELMFFGYSAMPPFCRYGVVDAQGELSHYEAIDLPAASMMHDFVVTDRHSIICDFPLKIRPEKAMAGGSPMSWEPSFGTRFGVLPRRGSNRDVRWFTTTPGFVYHFFNAYEDGDTIVIDACRMHATNFATSALDEQAAAEPVPVGEESEMARPHRYILDLKSGGVSEQRLHDAPSDFPRVHPGLVGRKHRYGYASAGRNEEFGTFTQVAKYDFEKGTVQYRKLGGEVRSGEWVFVPRPAAQGEDDGWLLGFVHDEANQQSEVWVLDARNLDTEPEARIKLKSRVPYGFHAEWISEAQIAAQR